MALHDILCVMHAPEGEPTPAFRQALALARAEKAHLSVVVIAPKAVAPYTPFYSGMVSSLVTEHNEKSREKADHAVKIIIDAMAIAGVTGDAHVIQDFVVEAGRAISAQARCSSVSMIDQPSDMLDTQQQLFEDLLFRSGRPLIIAAKGEPRQTIRRMALAWDGSSHAARAAGDALAMFKGLRTVDIVRVSGEKDLSKSLPGADFARHVSRAGIDTNLVELTLSHGSVAKTLDDYAATHDVDLIVMGGFGHSRLREFVLGGVTRDLTQTARVPLLLAN